MSPLPTTLDGLIRRNAELERRLAEAEQSLAAIGAGAVDAIVVGEVGSKSVYKLESADESYRTIVEHMKEGAVTLSTDGTVLYCNPRFAEMAGASLDELAGTDFSHVLDGASREAFHVLLSVDQNHPREIEARLMGQDGRPLPVQLVASAIRIQDTGYVCLVAVDLTTSYTNRQLAASEKLTRAILDSASEPMVVVNNAGMILRANRAASELVGSPWLLEHIDNAFSVHTGDPPVSERIAPAIQGRDIRAETIRLWRRDREPLEVSLSAAPLYSDSGAVIGAIITLSDLTPLRRLDAEVRGNEERLRLALQAGDFATFVGDLKEGRYYFDEAGQRLWDLPQGATFTDVAARFHPEDRERVAAASRRSQRDGTGINLEHRYLTTSGEVRWLSVRSSVKLDSSGRPWRTYGIAQDITARKLAEEKMAAQSRDLEVANQRLRQNEAQLSALFDSMVEPVLVVDRQGNVVLANAALRRSFAHLPADAGTLEGLRGLFTVSAPGCKAVPAGELPLARALLGERIPQIDVEFHDHITGRIHILSCSAAPILDESGVVTHAVLAGRDVTAIRSAEKALHDSEQRFRMAADVAFEAIWEWEIETGRVWRSQTFEGWFGGEVQGEAAVDWWRSSIHPEDAERTWTSLRQAVDGTALRWSAEYRLRRLDGSWADVLDRALIARAAGGEAERLVGSLLDMTERRHSERERERLLDSERSARSELERNRARVQLILESAGVGTWIFDPATREFSASALAKSMHGLSADASITGEDALCHVQHDDRPRVRDLVQHTLRTGDPLFSEHRLSLPDGRERWVRSQATFEVDPSSGSRGLMGIVQDITSQKRTEQHLRATAERLSALVEANPIGIMLANVDGAIVSVNSALLRMLGYSREEFEAIPRTWIELTPPEWAASDAQGIREARKQGLCRPYEKEYIRKGGSRLPIMIGYALLDGSGGDCVCFILDMTELKHARQDLEATNRDLARSNEDLQRFAYVISHDLQEPLRMISTFTELLLRRVEHAFDDDARGFAQQITGSTDRMRDLIRGVLELSRTGHHAPEISDGVDSGAILGLALQHLHARIKECQAEVTADLLPKISVDATLLLQLFQNLVGNAVKYRRGPSPSIHVAANLDEDNWVFSVQDNGIGIDMQFAQQIFLPFKRLHARDRYPGTGVGLAVCKRIVEQHGGRIWVDSTPGAGSTFFFTIPA
jgi:PAS domain S-box-containing protein